MFPAIRKLWSCFVNRIIVKASLHILLQMLETTIENRKDAPVLQKRNALSPVCFQLKLETCWKVLERSTGSGAS